MVSRGIATVNVMISYVRSLAQARRKLNLCLRFKSTPCLLFGIFKAQIFGYKREFKLIPGLRVVRKRAFLESNCQSTHNKRNSDLFR